MPEIQRTPDVDYKSAAESAVFVLLGKNKVDTDEYRRSVTSAENILKDFDRAKIDEEAERMVFVLTGRDRPKDAASKFDNDPRFQEAKQQYDRSVASAKNILRNL